MQPLRKIPGRIREGYRFRPTDVHLVDFLMSFAHGKPVPPTGPIKLKDVSCGIEPWQIFENSRQRTLYFFTLPNKCLSKNSSSPIKGRWTTQGKGKPIYRFNIKDPSQLIGYKRILRYRNKNLPQHDGAYMMTEYSLAEEIKAKLKPSLKDFVVCQIKRKRVARLGVIQNIISETPSGVVELQPKLDHLLSSFDEMQLDAGHATTAIVHEGQNQ
ncbi:unnamed protein product [Cuscuta epithymum]|uniref:NAC domain-containing protein n=1 Tax=Cuscuta epithymum TaxID=186058 RepID=A0AAV0E0J7_9ASTE|nr:unnamed protein product [Cuscuta epithymum]